MDPAKMTTTQFIAVALICVCLAALMKFYSEMPFLLAILLALMALVALNGFFSISKFFFRNIYRFKSFIEKF